MDLGSTTPPLGMSKEGEMPEYLLNSKMLKLFTAESGFSGGGGGRGGVITVCFSVCEPILFIFNLDAQVSRVAAG